MKNLIIMSLLIFPMLGISQAPQRINFQSILRNTTGEVISNSSVGLRISILSDSITGPAVYVETHSRTTDAGGLMSLQIGSGTLPSTDFAAIDWGGSAHFIKLEADFIGGNNYVLLGTQELMSVPYALYASKTDTSVLNLAARFSPLNNKLNIVDTATMLLNYRTGLNNKVNILDTASMLQPYLRDADTTSMLSPYLRNADTTAMLANYRTGNNAKLNILDTASMLQPYLRDADTTSMLLPYLRNADTTAMLANYRTGINAKFNILDTASMLQPYLRDADTTSMLLPYLRNADTTAMLANYRTGINAKLNNADTSDMLNPYLRKADAVVSVETEPVFNASVAKGITETDTAYWNRKLNLSDTSNMLANYRTGLNNKVNTADTSNMLTNYRTGLNNKLNIIDTSTMLSKYLRKADTSFLSERINTKLNSSDFPNGTNTGNMLYWNGTSWVNLAPGNIGQSLIISSNNIPEWGSVPTNTVGGATSAPTLTVNTGLTPITHSTTNATGIGTATGLPTGVTASWSANRITISGTPSSLGTFSYNIPLSGVCECVNATGTITVIAPCAVGAASTTPTLRVNTALTNITHTTTSATGIGSATGLPSGVSAAWVSNVIIISGTPSASGNYNYTIPLTGIGCTSLNATGTIMVAVAACGSVSSVSDIDGNSYNTVSIGYQCWTKENLRVRRYNDSTEIKFDNSGGIAGNLSGSTWRLTYGAYTLYEHDSTTTPSKLNTYGYLYNWYAAKGIATTGSTVYKNICPTGWHVPTDTAWTALTIYLGGESVAGGKMKSIGTAYWNTQNREATNVSGFSAFPGGYRNYQGSFGNISYYAFFWSATEYDSNFAWNRSLNNDNGSVYRSTNFNGDNLKSVGASVRCLRD